MSNILVPLFLPFAFRDDSILIHNSKNEALVQGLLGENVSRNVEIFTKIESHFCLPNTEAVNAILAIQLSPRW